MQIQKQPHQHSEHSWRPYPTDHIVGVMDTESSSQETLKALKDQGVPENEIDLFHGRSITQACLSHDHQQRVLDKVATWLSSAFSDDADFAREYLDEAAHDHDLIMVHVARSEQVETVRQVLVAHGAHRLRYYALLTVTDL